MYFTIRRSANEDRTADARTYNLFASAVRDATYSYARLINLISTIRHASGCSRSVYVRIYSAYVEGIAILFIYIERERGTVKNTA